MHFSAYLMRVLSFIIGLIRSFGRYSHDRERPLISAIYPVPFMVPRAEGVNVQPVEVDRFAVTPVVPTYFLN